MLQNRQIQVACTGDFRPRSLLERPNILNRLPASAGGLLPQPPERTRFFDVATDEPIMAGMAARYAAALFELAIEAKALPQVELDLSKFQALLDMSDDLRRLVRSPVFSAEDQNRALGPVLEKAGISGLAANFVRLIASNRRLFAAPDMIRAFRGLAARHRGEIAAEVASAVALDDAQVAALKDVLKASIGKDVQLSNKVDPNLLGGLVVRVGSRMIDSSLRTKLSNLKVELKGAN